MSKRNNFEPFIGELIGKIGAGQLRVAASDRQFGDIITQEKCSWFSISFDDKVVNIIGDLLKNTSVFPLPYDFKLTPNTDARVPLPWPILSTIGFSKTITSKLEGHSLITIDVWETNRGYNLVVKITLSVAPENPEELVETWVYIPTKTTAKCVFKKVETIPNGYTWCK